MTAPVRDVQPALRLSNVSKSYGSVRALKDVDLEIRQGEVLALVGDNGAGKSTLAKIIAGAHLPDEGEMLLYGDPYLPESPRAAKELGIEMVYQDLGLLNNLSIAANVFLGVELRKSLLGRETVVLDKRRMAQQTSDLLERYGLDVGSSARKVSALSGGQRQLLAIAKTAGADPRLIIMDEPTAALGVQESEKVLTLIRQLKESGTTVLVISHNLAQVFTVADRVAVLRRGANAGIVETSSSTPSEVVHYITGAEFERAEPKQNGELG